MMVGSVDASGSDNIATFTGVPDGLLSLAISMSLFVLVELDVFRTSDLCCTAPDLFSATWRFWSSSECCFSDA